ncbi:ATP-dependent DNA helicase [Mycena indigotica]|uniref:ATP-dependent DNA helicase n=1 Tax=Mycena indigotica TaxID=2126181 RepID=A0A8H6SQ86_9AGAR|nr:ATP-dependent DNA helicase [Mycena indigotica]KAF7301990.1 ATP-dependent DNA helicase [Mycena indigotica]
MWIGDVPFQLSILTLPEQLLVSLYFPSAYIIKIYPKNVKSSPQTSVEGTGATVSNEKLRGNVSTFKLPTSEIAEMVAGNLVPQPSMLLAATIGVTFVGAGSTALGCMPGLFRVRRQRVFEALMWLKENNPLYSEVIISQERLKQLPENGVPEEIMQSVRYSGDVDAVGREHAGYVPMEEEEEGEPEEFNESDELAMGEMTIEEQEELSRRYNSDEIESVIAQLDSDVLGVEDDVEGQENIAEFTEDRNVFPLQTHGVIDVGGENIPDATLFAHAVENSIPATFAQDYGVRKGNAFVNEFARRDENEERFDGGPSNPNHLLGAFPMLFPYGRGGFEVDRKVKVTYEEHVRWALQHESGRFRRHTSFIFQVFGVLWKRQVCRSTSLLIDHDAFVANQEDFMKLRPKDLLEASEEENHKVTISNPTIRLLRRYISTVRAKVPGTDENRVSIRSQIWGMSLKFNPPSIWMTINLADTSDPIAQVLAGVEIDLDK